MPPALLVGLVSAFAALFACEAVLRLAARHRRVFEADERMLAVRETSLYRASADPFLVYEHRPGYARRIPASGGRAASPMVNRAGLLRPDEVSKVPPEGTLRVALVGDSVAASPSYPTDRGWTRCSSAPSPPIRGWRARLSRS